MRTKTVKKSAINFNYLLDCAEFVSYSTRIPDNIHQLCMSRQNMQDFEMIRGIAKGGYGSVYLVQSRQTHQYYALKIIKKQVVIDMPHLALFENEKAALISARESQYLVSMHCSFQDRYNIYFLMDFHPCDLLEVVPTQDENSLRFYAANILLAIEELHGLGYVHRDIKPENIFVDVQGYIKLADFGSCCRIRETEQGRDRTSTAWHRERRPANDSASTSSSASSKSGIMVGTPDYIAPECFKNEQGIEVDMWAYGIVLYEMKNDITPFYAETLSETQKKIRNIEYEKETGTFGDLIDHLLRYKNERYTVQQCKEHAFFEGIDFDNFRKIAPAFRPKGVTDKEDVKIENEEIEQTYEFVGFSYDPGFDDVSIDIGKRVLSTNAVPTIDDTSQHADGDSLHEEVHEDEKMNKKMNEEINEEMNEKMNEKMQKYLIEGTHKNENDTISANGMHSHAVYKDHPDCHTCRHCLYGHGSTEEMASRVHNILQTVQQIHARMDMTVSIAKRMHKYKQRCKELKKKNSMLAARMPIRQNKNEVLFRPGCKRKAEDGMDNRMRERSTSADSKMALEQKLPRGKCGILIKSEQVIELEKSMERLQCRNDELERQAIECNEMRRYHAMRLQRIRKQIGSFNYFVNTTVNNIRASLGHLNIFGFVCNAKTEIRALKKQLKVKEQEKKEIELKNNTEIKIRKRLEKEILRCKNEIKQLKTRGDISTSFRVQVDGVRTMLKIEKNQLFLFNITEHLSNCVCANLNNPEKMKYKRKNVVKLVFIEETTPSITATRPRSVIISELEKERRLRESIKRLGTMHTGRMLEKVLLQLESSTRRIEHLQTELNNADEDDTDSEQATASDAIPYDGHVFVPRKRMSGYCYFCDEPHYSTSLHCERCDITVHRQCYMLTMSCDMCVSVKKGKSFMIEMRNFEEAERLAKILKKDM